MSGLNITRTDLGGTPYAFLDAIVYHNTIYAVQKYKSGVQCRLVIFSRNQENGSLSFNDHITVLISTSVTDAALVVWGDRLYVFWKFTGSNWQVCYRCYGIDPNAKKSTDLIEYDTFDVTPDCHCYNYMDAVVFQSSLYLLMAVNRDKKDRIELRRSNTTVTDKGKLSFEEKVTFVSNGSTEVTNIKNSDTDTWDAQVWKNSKKGQNGLPDELLIVGRIHDGIMTAYTWDGKNWSPAVTTNMPNSKERSSLKLIQTGALQDGDTTTDAMYFVFIDSWDKIKMRRYLPIERRFDNWEESTETDYGWMGVTAIRNEMQTKYQDEIHIISGRECQHNYDTMVKGTWVNH